MYTTGNAGFYGCQHIEPDHNGKKDFSTIIEQAKNCEPPVEIVCGTMVGGFAHNRDSIILTAGCEKFRFNKLI